MPPQEEDNHQLREPLLQQDEEENVPLNAGEQQEDCDDANDETFSYRSELYEMANLGIPLAVSFFCRMGMASTDSAFVGHIVSKDEKPATYLAAAVLADMVVSVITVPPLAFNQVLNGLVGQAMGSGNPKMAGVWLQQSMVWLSITMLPCLIGFFYVKPVLLLLGFPETVSEVAGLYAKFNVVWPIPNGLYQCMRFYFQAQGLPRPAMYNNILFLFVNAFLNWLFVFGGPCWKGFGFVGAAISLSISRTMQGVVYYVYMFWYKQHHLNTWPDAGWSLKHHTWAITKEFLQQSVPNIGTLLFQAASNQATTILVGRLGEAAIAASSALSTVTIPWGGTLNATCMTISGVRVGYHLGRGQAQAAKTSTWMMLYFITAVNILVALVVVPYKQSILRIATSDQDVLDLSATLVPALFVGTYLNLLVSNITSGVFSGMGRPMIAAILSFGFELPMSIGGVALYILVMHGKQLLGVYWWQAIAGGLEVVVVFFIMLFSDWEYWAEKAQQRQTVSNIHDEGAEDDDAAEEEATSTAANGGDLLMTEPLLQHENAEHQGET